MAVSVKFYQRPHYMEFKSDAESRPIHEMRDYVRIEIPGIVANVVDTLANETHKREHAVQWHQYLIEKETGVFSEHQGTLLSEWPQLNAAMALEIKHYKFHTVEQIAEASDQQIQAIGMLAGMSPLSLRDKAKAWLAKAVETDKEADSKAEVAKRDEQILAMQAQLQALMQIVQAAPVGDVVRAVKNKGGRPKKPPPEALAA